MRRTKNKTLGESRSLKRKLKAKGLEDKFSIKFDSEVGQSKCRVCRPFDFENYRGAKNGKHGKTKPKYKNKR